MRVPPRSEGEELALGPPPGLRPESGRSVGERRRGRSAALDCGEGAHAGSFSSDQKTEDDSGGRAVAAARGGVVVVVVVVVGGGEGEQKLRRVRV